MVKQKYEKVILGELNHPVFIVGINPGKQRVKDRTYRVWQGNRSGDFINEIVSKYENVLLTNISNYENPTGVEIQTGIDELMSDITIHDPKVIICLGIGVGDLLKKVLKSLKDTRDNRIVVLLHPSYILRFALNTANYRKSLEVVLNQYAIKKNGTKNNSDNR